MRGRRKGVGGEEEEEVGGGGGEGRRRWCALVLVFGLNLLILRHQVDKLAREGKGNGAGVRGMA